VSHPVPSGPPVAGLAPDIRLNLGAHGAGLSVGPRRFVRLSNRRGMYSSAGIPGTGIYAVHHIHPSAEHHPRVVGSSMGFVVGVVFAVIIVVLVVVVYSSR
jgi:hypothetical protein